MEKDKSTRKQKPLIERWLEDDAPFMIIKTAEQAKKEKLDKLKEKDDGSDLL